MHLPGIGVTVGTNTTIESAHHSFNPWIGCTRISPACDHCYAAVINHRFGGKNWGTGAPRPRTSEGNWTRPLAWDRAAARDNIRRRVFCASLADVFDNEVQQEWRDDLFTLIRQTPHLDWLLLTKRVVNVPSMLPADWGTGYPNVWLGVTAVNQNEVERDIPKLQRIPAAIHWLSMEPLLGPVTFTAQLLRLIRWIVVGGEAGAKARAMHPQWATQIRNQCSAMGVAFLFKQWGEWLPILGHAHCVQISHRRFEFPDGTLMGYAGKKNAGRLLEGRTWNEYPTNSTIGQTGNPSMQCQRVVFKSTLVTGPLT